MLKKYGILFKAQEKYLYVSEQNNLDMIHTYIGNMSIQNKFSFKNYVYLITEVHLIPIVSET